MVLEKLYSFYKYLLTPNYGARHGLGSGDRSVNKLDLPSQSSKSEVNIGMSANKQMILEYENPWVIGQSRNQGMTKEHKPG